MAQTSTAQLDLFTPPPAERQVNAPLPTPAAKPSPPPTEALDTKDRSARRADGPTCQGFVNFPTCAVMLWLRNDRDLDAAFQIEARRLAEVAREAEEVADGIWPEDLWVRIHLAEAMRRYVERHNPLRNAPESKLHYASLLDHAIDTVDWRECAREYITISAENGPLSYVPRVRLTPAVASGPAGGPQAPSPPQPKPEPRRSTAAASGLVRIPRDVLEVLAQGTADGNLFRLSEQLEANTYAAVDRALRELGGRWNRRLGAHVFDSPAADRIGAALATGFLESEKKKFQFYETEKPEARRVVELARLSPGLRTLEPSAGHGAIADEIRAAGVEPLCVELDPKKVRVLRAKGYEVIAGDFLALELGTFDRILLNPPFRRLQDASHAARAYDLLAPGGIAVAIMSRAFLERREAKAVDFRRLVEAHGHVYENRSNACRASGTAVRTLTVVLERAA